MPSLSTFLQKAVFLYFCHSLAEYITGLISFPKFHPSKLVRLAIALFLVQPIRHKTNKYFKNFTLNSLFIFEFLRTVRLKRAESPKVPHALSGRIG